MAKVLIVEDDLTLNSAYKLILEKENHQVETAFNGEEALATAEAFGPDIILLDLLMPKMNGLEFLRKYDLARKHHDTHVVILSNLDAEKDIEKARELGAYKYIIKAHLSPKELATLINHLIKKNLS